MTVDPHRREMFIEYDADEKWLVENDGFGASQIVARDIPAWLGTRIVAALQQRLDEKRLARAMRWAGIRSEPEYATIEEAAHQLAGYYASRIVDR